MRSVVVLLAIAGLSACAQSPVVQQSTVDTRYDPIRSDESEPLDWSDLRGVP